LDGSLAIGPKDIRAYALSNRAREARKSGITRVYMSTVDTDPNGELKYATGFFAYEYLAAHYGIPATFAWLTQWNSPACTTSQCWRDTANQTFGISADELNRRLNAYVTAQLAQARSMP